MPWPVIFSWIASPEPRPTASRQLAFIAMSALTWPTCATNACGSTVVVWPGLDGQRDRAAVGEHDRGAVAVQLGGEQPLPADRAAHRAPDAALAAQEHQRGLQRGVVRHQPVGLHGERARRADVDDRQVHAAVAVVDGALALGDHHRHLLARHHPPRHAAQAAARGAHRREPDLAGVGEHRAAAGQHLPAGRDGRAHDLPVDLLERH